jgi:hypothetical protein
MVGDLINDAMRGYLARVAVRQRTSTLRALQPELFPEGNERLSTEIDAACAGDRTRLEFSDWLAPWT